MTIATLSLREDYWETFQLQPEDIEFIYNHLLETETPKTPRELLSILVAERIRREKQELENQRSSGGDIYLPKGRYQVNQSLAFPALGWKRGRVVSVRNGENPDMAAFEVMKVAFDDGLQAEYAMGLEEHFLNQPIEIDQDDLGLNQQEVMKHYGEDLLAVLEDSLDGKDDFVRIAGRWFPRALLIDINLGHLNLAEAVLDMAGGGPLPTAELISQIGLTSSVNPKLLEFSFDLALEEDDRFDEVGPAGRVLWYLRRLEPQAVLDTPLWLRPQYHEVDRSVLSKEMIALERELDDELSPLDLRLPQVDEVELRLVYPHLRSGTFPLSARVRHLFPTAYEAPRIRFMLVDGDTGEAFPAWVVRQARYVYGLGNWYKAQGLFPGSLIRIRRGERPGEVIIKSQKRRPTREWVRTVLVGSDGGVVYAMLKQNIGGAFDERMTIAVPDQDAIDQIWQQMQKDRVPFDRIVVDTVRELAKLNPQSHVHASELYAAINMVRRCPPAQVLETLAMNKSFVHVGDMHFRYRDGD